MILCLTHWASAFRCVRWNIFSLHYIRAHFACGLRKTFLQSAWVFVLIPVVRCEKQLLTLFSCRVFIEDFLSLIMLVLSAVLISFFRLLLFPPPPLRSYPSSFVLCISFTDWEVCMLCSLLVLFSFCLFACELRFCFSFPCVGFTVLSFVRYLFCVVFIDILWGLIIGFFHLKLMLRFV